MRHRSSSQKIRDRKFEVWSVALEAIVFQSFTRMIGLGFMLFLLLNFSILNAQIQTKLDPQVILIGDSASLQITVNLNVDDLVDLPLPGDSLNNYIEITAVKTDTLFLGNELKIIRNFTLTGFEAGRFLINSLPVSINGKIYQSAALQLEIQDIQVGEDLTQMYPIKPIMTEEISLWEKYKKYVWYFALGLLLALLVLLLIWLYFKEKKKNKYISSPLLPPYEEAIANLKKLDEAGFIQQQKYYEFYSDLSQILRRYFTRRFDFPANALLSSDLPKFMYNKEFITDNERDELEIFLKETDLVKFARNIPDEEKHHQYRKWTEDLIYRTRPVFEENLADDGFAESEKEKIRKIDNR
ncbi:MAG: hypothetical protein Q4G27_08025 [Flavobacteriaceae bacterium]|nr:hypothetical protein [Flavobacteriaceae bacterium]